MKGSDAQKVWQATDLAHAICNMIDARIRDARPEHQRAPKDERNYFTELVDELMKLTKQN